MAEFDRRRRKDRDARKGRWAMAIVAVVLLVYVVGAYLYERHADEADFKYIQQHPNAE